MVLTIHESGHSIGNNKEILISFPIWKDEAMLAQEPNRKKRIETHYIEEARRASVIFPSGRLEPHEKPDFLLFADRGKIGIEVTELCREEPRAEAGRLSKVPEQAKAIYGRFTDAKPVDVSIGFWRAETVTFNALTKTLAEFVYASRARRGRILDGDFPLGFCHIGVQEPSRPSGHWHATRAFDTVVAPKEIITRRIAGRIAEKNSRVAHYRLAASVPGTRRSLCTPSASGAMEIPLRLRQGAAFLP
jgi:hypothetical protein